MKKMYPTLLLGTLTLGSFSCGDASEQTTDKTDNTRTETAPEKDSSDETTPSEAQGTQEIKRSWTYRSKAGENGLIGFVDNNDHWVLKPQFYAANSNMRYGMAAVKNEDWKYGYCNEAGVMVVDYQYRFAGDFTHDGTAPVKLAADTWQYIDKTGNVVLETSYEQCGGFWEGVAYVSNSNGAGLIDQQGNVVIPLKYGHLQSTVMEDGKGTYFTMNGGVASVSLKSTGKFGLINSKGEELCDFKYDAMPVYAQKHGTVVVKIGEKYGVISDQGKEILACEFEDAMVNNLSDQISVKKDGKSMKYNLNGECTEGCE